MQGDRKLAAILAADVAGYSRLMEDDEAATVRTLTEYREIFGNLGSHHGGRVVDTAGDSVLAVFDSPVEAVDCAVEIQRALDRRNRQLAPHRRMQFRIGINLGDVIFPGDGTVYGDGVNVASRLQALALPGGVCVSSTVYDHVEGKVLQSFVPGGEHIVKNISRPVRAYHVNPDSRAKVGAARTENTGESVGALQGTGAGQNWASVLRSSSRWIVVLALSLVLASAAAVWMLSRTAPERAAGPMRVAMIGLYGHPYPRRQASWFALSPDGLLVYSDEGSNSPMLSRKLDAEAVAAVDGTNGGDTPFISVDGRMLGFERDGQMFVLPTSGGSTTRVKNASVLAWAGRPAWTEDNHIVYTGERGGLVRVQRDGESPQQLTSPPAGTRHLSPLVLPDGTILFTEVSGTVNDAHIVAVHAGDHHTSTIVAGGALTPQYADGFLFYCRPDGTLMAAPFDAVHLQLTGEAHPLAQRVDRSRFGVAHYVAAPGVLLYAPLAQTRLVEMDTGGAVTVLTEQGRWHMPRYSPDGGTRVVFDRVTGVEADRDIWTLSRSDGSLSRVTRIGDAHDPSWLPNGEEISFLSFKSADGPLMIARADGSGEARGVNVAPVVGPFPAGQLLNPGVWRPDGSAYLGGVVVHPGNSDIWRFPREGALPTKVVVGAFDEHSPSISADGQWLAYQSNETGRPEVFVRAVSELQGRVQISNAGATAPVWDKRSLTLYYVEQDGTRTHLMAASLRAAATLTVTSRRMVLPDVRMEEVENHPNYDVSESGTKFIMPESAPTIALGVIFDVSSSLSDASAHRK